MLKEQKLFCIPFAGEIQKRLLGKENKTIPRLPGSMIPCKNAVGPTASFAKRQNRIADRAVLQRLSEKVRYLPPGTGNSLEEYASSVFARMPPRPRGF